MTALGAVSHIDHGEGAPLLALHGGMGGADQAFLFAAALAPDLTRWRLIAPTRPAYGGARATAPTLDAEADRLASLLDQLGIGRITVAALSAGGPVAIAFALRHAERCDRLLLASAITGRMTVRPDLLRGLRLGRLAARLPFIKSFLRRRLAADPARAVRRLAGDADLARRLLSDPEAFGLLHALEQSLLTRSVARIDGTSADLHRIARLPPFQFEALAMPVLAIHGRADRVVPFDHAASLAARAPNARLLPIEHGRHLALFTHLAEARSAILPFLHG
ncbi:Pimeloyl-ACP methyl ester carboxylesterase [Kaistia soli DSM 19436]|uniref:Pimeloyl-ACP methyl ester carboxylesterase n=1 Tax=Kaistia soli DSM 19436 TaxID=1122133 RepID=A0A1M5J1I8_9HYPH|nr:alpha/beta hydrolase [Kaistia soli]SHG33873.1 Pimeloyl-ACP methyl ester carboxylesterase [Kaistia soli DSM 19436]